MNKKILLSLLSIAIISTTITGCGFTKNKVVLQEESVQSDSDTSNDVSDGSDESDNSSEPSGDVNANSSDSSDKKDNNGSGKNDKDSNNSQGSGSKYSDSESNYIFNYSVFDVKKLLGDPSKEKNFDLFGESTGLMLTYDDSNTIVEVDVSSDRVYNLSTKSNDIKHIRGVAIGDSLNSVKGKFMFNASNAKKEYPDDAAYEYSLLYGTYSHRQPFGLELYKKGSSDVEKLIYASESSRVEFSFKNSRLVNVKYNLSLT